MGRQGVRSQQRRPIDLHARGVEALKGVLPWFDLFDLTVRQIAAIADGLTVLARDVPDWNVLSLAGGNVGAELGGWGIGGL